jgi:adenine specific DNA methylase Mod
MGIEVDGKKFFFDVSMLEHKKANEKRNIIYSLKEKRKDTIVFTVTYTEKGRKTKTDDILKALQKDGDKISEDLLERAFRTFGKQSEVDYFINKDAKAFLEEQFNLWLYQYTFSGVSEWTDTRVKQLQSLKNIAFKVIAFISQFENELVKIWNKPKFVLNSNYVITLDRVAEKDISLVEKLLAHKNLKAQIEEWQELGIVTDSFKKTTVLEKSLEGKRLARSYQHLPIDTRHFKDLELDILRMFNNLDAALDGWLIKSENFQALKTIMPKFIDKIDTIYIDPPFNKEKEADYQYSVKYKDATWASILENKAALAKDLIKETGSMFVRCDYNGTMFVRNIMADIFSRESFRNEIVVKRGRETVGTLGKYEQKTESIFYYAKSPSHVPNEMTTFRPVSDIQWTGFLMGGERKPRERVFLGKELLPPPGQHFPLGQDKVVKLLNEFHIRLRCRKCGAKYYHASTQYELNHKMRDKKHRFKFYDVKQDDEICGVEIIDKCVICRGNDFAAEYLGAPERKINSEWLDIESYSKNWSFFTENSEQLLNRVICAATKKNDIVMDYFLGSGTTVAVAHKLGRRWIGIEMGNHFANSYQEDGQTKTGILGRMKEVLSAHSKHEPSGISAELKWNGGGFFKYYEMEQYEDALRHAKYGEGDLFDDPNKDAYNQYIFLRDLKMLEVLDVDTKGKKVKVDLSKLYDEIDIAETLSNLTGKWIKRINAESVEFDDGEVMDTKNLDWKRIKPLIWW